MRNSDSNDYIQEKLKTAMPFIISGLIVAFLLVYRFVDAGLKDTVNLEDLFMSFTITASILVLMRLCWFPSGKDSVRRNKDSSYCKNAKAYSDAVSTINEKRMHQALREYCAIKTAELLQVAKETMLNGVGLNIDDYEKKYKALTLKDIRCKKDLTFGQKRVIAKVKRGIRIKAIDCTTLLTDSVVKKKNSYGIEYNERLEEGLSTGMRVLQKLLTSLVCCLIGWKLAADIYDVGAWAEFVMQLILVITSSWGGYRDGVRQLEIRKNDVLKRRKTFLDGFFESQNA